MSEDQQTRVFLMPTAPEPEVSDSETQPALLRGSDRETVNSHIRHHFYCSSPLLPSGQLFCVKWQGFKSGLTSFPWSGWKGVIMGLRCSRGSLSIVVPPLPWWWVCTSCVFVRSSAVHFPLQTRISEKECHDWTQVTVSPLNTGLVESRPSSPVTFSYSRKSSQRVIVISLSLASLLYSLLCSTSLPSAVIVTMLQRCPLVVCSCIIILWVVCRLLCPSVILCQVCQWYNGKSSSHVVTPGQWQPFVLVPLTSGCVGHTA